ncbi:MAG TPA: hypothetical protein VMA09_05595 [Candidatus Binataceae bacterium]|nr:hypothetical protein [Candidatus Binataceae bacterium]
MKEFPKLKPMAQSDDRTKNNDGEHREPPAVYFPACGALCDIFWWARRNDSKTESSTDPEANPSPVISREKVPDARKRASGG